MKDPRDMARSIEPHLRTLAIGQGPPMPEGRKLVAWLDRFADLTRLDGTANPALMESIEELRRIAVQRAEES